MAVTVTGRRGKKVVLLNPQEKREKYFNELSEGVKMTNDPKTRTIKRKGINGKVVRLDDKARAYRAGYIQAQNDSAKCYNATTKKK